MLFVSEACDSAGVVTDPNVRGIVTYSIVRIRVWCHVGAAIARWGAVASTVEENVLGCSSHHSRVRRQHYSWLPTFKFWYCLFLLFSSYMPLLILCVTTFQLKPRACHHSVRQNLESKIQWITVLFSLGMLGLPFPRCTILHWALETSGNVDNHPFCESMPWVALGWILSLIWKLRVGTYSFIFKPQILPAHEGLSP